MNPNIQDIPSTPARRLINWAMGQPRNGDDTAASRPFSWGVALSRISWKWAAWLWDHPLRRVLMIIAACLGAVVLGSTGTILGAKTINHSVAVICDLPYIPFITWGCPLPPSPAHTSISLAPDSSALRNVAPKTQGGSSDWFDGSFPRAEQIPRLLRKLEMAISKAEGLIGTRESSRTPEMRRLLSHILSTMDELIPKAIGLQPLVNYVMDGVVMVQQMESTYAFRAQDKWGLAVYGTRLTDEETFHNDPEGKLDRAIEDVLADADSLIVAIEELSRSAVMIKQLAHELYVLADREVYEGAQNEIALRSKFWTMVGGNKRGVLRAEEWVIYAEALKSIGEETLALAIYFRSDALEWTSQLHDLKKRLTKLKSTEHGPARVGMWTSIGCVYQRWVSEGRVIPGSLSWLGSLSPKTREDTGVPEFLD